MCVASVCRQNNARQAWRNGRCLWAKQAKRKCGSVWAEDFSLSLSLSRCSHFLASLWAKFKRLFYSFYRNFILSYRKFFLFHRSFNSSFYLQKSFFRILCFFEIFKHFVLELFALVIASRFHKNGGFCHIERSDPAGCKAQAAAKISTEFKTHFLNLWILRYAQYDKVCQYNKIDDKKSVWYDKTSQHNKFGLLSKNDGRRKRTLPFGKDGYFHSNRFQKFEKFNTKESK